MCLSDWRNIGEFEQFKILNTPFKNQQESGSVLYAIFYVGVRDVFLLSCLLVLSLCLNLEFRVFLNQ